jgi:chromosome partitioning protein
VIVLAIVNQKGGVGKTTTAVTLGHGLALRYKRRVLIVDLDAQGNLADVLGLEKRRGLQALLVTDDGGKAITWSGRVNLDVVLGDKSTVAAKQTLAGMSFREYELKKALARVAGDYDVMILDAAPGCDVLQIGALVACSHFLIPAKLDHLAVVGAGDVLGTVVSLQQVNAFGGQFLGILPTMWDRRLKEGDYQIQYLAETYRRLVWPPIPVDAQVAHATVCGKTLWEYAPKGRGIRGAVYMNGLVGGYAQVLDRLWLEVVCDG